MRIGPRRYVLDAGRSRARAVAPIERGTATRPLTPRATQLSCRPIMRPLPAFLGCVLLSACGASPPAASPPGPVASAAPPAPATSATTIPAPPKPSPPVLALEAERRAVLDELVAFDTSHGNEIGALRPIARRFEDIGLHADLFEALPGRGDLVVRLKGSGAKKPLLLLAHIDVVPVEGQPWTVPPFATTEKDGFLYGRGVNDDKGMAAAFVAIALDLARSHAALSRDVIVALTAGEETDGIGRPVAPRAPQGPHRRRGRAQRGRLGDSTSADFSRVEAVEVGAAEKIFQSYRLVVQRQGRPFVDPSDRRRTPWCTPRGARSCAWRSSGSRPRVLPPVTRGARACTRSGRSRPCAARSSATAANARPA